MPFPVHRLKCSEHCIHKQTPGHLLSQSCPRVDMTRDAQAPLSQALGQNTRAVYRRAWVLYGEYALSQNILVAIPVTGQSLFLFIVYMKKQQYAAATITSYVSAIGYVHKLAGTNDQASSFLVKKIFAGYQKDATLVRHLDTHNGRYPTFVSVRSRSRDPQYVSP